MSMDIESLLAEVSPEAPSGEDLEYDPAFIDLEQSAQGKPERVMGDEVHPAEDPNWRELRQKSLDLFTRTKDLRVVVHLVRALLDTDGLTGVRDGLSLTKGLLERFWATVHPQLDPDDNNDPTMRMNTIGALTGETFLARLRKAPLAHSRALGVASLRDVQIATGVLTPVAEEETADPATVDAVFMDCELEELQANAEAVSNAVETVTSIETFLTEQVGVENALDMSGLSGVLKNVNQVLAEQLSRRGVGVETGGDGGEGEGAGGGEGAAGAPAVSGAVNSRDDVVRLLDKICDYLERTEPSSPVPLLLRRAKRLVSKNFMEILRDMAPDGVSQAETVTGVDSQEE